MSRLNAAAKRSFLCACVGAVFVCPTLLSADDTTAAAQLLASIIMELQERNRRIDDLVVRYERSASGVTPKEEYGVKQGTDFSEVHRIDFAICRTMHRELQTDIVSAIPSWFPVDSSKPSLCYWFDGAQTVKYNVGPRIALRQRIDLSRPMSFRHEYLGNLGLWLYDDHIRSEVGNGYFLPQALATYPYQVRPERETIDGVECVVLVHSAASEATTHTHDHDVAADTLWLDPTAGWSIRRRELVRPASPVLQGTKGIVTASDYREVAPGIWFPWDLRIQHCRLRRNSLDSFATITDTRIKVEQLEINSIRDTSIFRPALLDGTLIKNLDSNTEQALTGGIDLLYERVDRLKAYHGWADRARGPASPWVLLLVIGVVATAAICLVGVILPSRPLLVRLSGARN